jgi:hypothetical protein
MIAAAQLRRRRLLNYPLPVTMFGVLVVADQFAFVRASISKEYFECLDQQRTPPPLEFHWWPEETRSKYPNFVQPNACFGIHYGNVTQRAIIVKTLCLMRNKFFADLQ